MTHAMAPAKLDDASLDELRHLEEEMGTVLVALNPAPTLAELSDDKLERLRQAESRLGVVMVAYDT